MSWLINTGLEKLIHTAVGRFLQTQLLMALFVICEALFQGNSYLLFSFYRLPLRNNTKKKPQTRQNQQKRTYYGVVPERGLQVALTVM